MEWTTYSSTPQGMKIPLLCFTGGLATGIIMSKLIRNPIRKDKIPDKWIRVGTITELIIYPVKSLPGVHVDKAIVTSLGLKGETSHSILEINNTYAIM
jgi:hypothetical protein